MKNYLPGIYLSREGVEALSDLLHYKFSNLSLLSEAFEAAGSGPAPQGSKRLAHVGDGVLRLVLYLDGYGRSACTGNFYSFLFPSILTNIPLLIGDIARFHDHNACNANLAMQGFARGLHTFIRLNPSALGLVPDKLMATTMEAIIGAVFLDSNQNMDIARNVIVELGLLER